jgi:hypothetical protein
MSGNDKQNRPAPSRAAVYEIVVNAVLDGKWASHFHGLTLTHHLGEGTTTLKGQVIDQTALHSHLQTIRDLNLTLLSIRFCGPA